MKAIARVFAGGSVVLDHQAEEGETVAAGAPIVTIADLSRTRISAEVDKFDAPSLREGAEVAVSVQGLPGRSFRGRVSEIPDGRAGEAGWSRNAPRPGGPGRRPRSRRGTRACARGGHRLRAGDDATWDVSVSAAAALRARRRDRGEDGQTTRRRSGVPRAMPKLELEADNRRPTIAAPHSSRLGEPSRPAAVPRTRRAWVSADRDRSGGDRRQMEPDCRSQAVRNQDGRD